MNPDPFKSEYHRLRKIIADHLRRSRRLRHVEPDLSREHRALADLYKRHIEIEIEFGRDKSQGLLRDVALTLFRNR